RLPGRSGAGSIGPMRFPPPLRPSGHPPLSRRALLRLLATAPVLALPACAATTKQVCVTADGARRCSQTQARYVRDVLQELAITLGEDDRIEPGDWAPVIDGTEIVVVRVESKTETSIEALPFARRSVIGAGLAVGEQRLLQAGHEGQEEIVYQVTIEDGQEVERRLLSRRVVATPQEEIVASGAATARQEFTFSGTIAYLSQGNVWVMRGTNAAERALTTAGDLDGRVFDLSADGKAILVTRRLDGAMQINELCTLGTDVVGGEPEPLGIGNVLAARWSPDGASLAYSGGEATEGSPGWRAFGDVQLLALAGSEPPRQLRPGGCTGTYCWWGPELAWSTDGQVIYLTDASSLRAIPLAGGEERLIAEYPPLRTRSEWVWVPRAAAHPTVAAVAMAWHQDAGDGSAVEDSQRFDAVLVDVTAGTVTVLAADVGMWARPQVSPPGADGTVRLAYAVATERAASANSTYEMWVAAADGSDPRRAYPAEEAPAPLVTDFCWAPDGSALALVADGDVYLYGVADGSLQPLSPGVGAERVLWAR
ncbi:MAG: G5 domain-containing protein, partial [Anaerolineae bacterium]